MNDETRSTPNPGLQIGDIESRLTELLGTTDTATDESTDDQELEQGTELVEEDDVEDDTLEASADDAEGEDVNAQDDQQSDEPRLLTEEEEGSYLIDMGDGQQMSVDDVRRGFMRDAHFTQNMQQIAETKRTLQTTSDNLDAAVFSVAHILDAELEPYQNVNWEQLAMSNQQAYQQYKPQFDALMGYVDRIKSIYGQAQEQIQETAKKQLDQAWEQTDTHLKFRIPKWGDERKDQITKFAKRYGFEPDELKGVPDHRLWSALNDLERLTSGVSAGKGKPKPKRRVKGEQNKGSRVAQLKQRASKGDRQAENALRAMSIDAKLKKMGIN